MKYELESEQLTLNAQTYFPRAFQLLDSPYNYTILFTTGKISV